MSECDCTDCRPPAYLPPPYIRDEDEARRDKYAAELEDERRQHHLDRFAQLDRRDRTGPNH